MSNQYTATHITRYALYALLIFTPLARGSVQGWSISIVHLVTLIALSVLLLEKCLKREWQWTRTPLDIPIACVLVLSIFSTIFSVHPRTSVWALILLINYVVIFYLVINTIRTRDLLRKHVYLVIGIATFISIFGLFKRFGANPFPWWEYGDLTYSPIFLSATFGNHNHMAGYLGMVIPLAFGLLLTGLKKAGLLLMIYFACIMIATLVLTLSRGGWISFFLGLLFMVFLLMTSGYFHRKGFLLVVMGGVFILALIALANTPVIERLRTVSEREEEASFHSRVIAWKGVVQMIKDHPALGTGPGTFATYYTQYQPPGLSLRFTKAHNDYLQFVSEVGLLLIPFLIWMIIALYGRGLKKLKNPSRLVRGMTIGAMTGITVIIFHSIIDFNLHIPANALLFATLAAIVASPLPRDNIGRQA